MCVCVDVLETELIPDISDIVTGSKLTLEHTIALLSCNRGSRQKTLTISDKQPVYSERTERARGDSLRLNSPLRA